MKSEVGKKKGNLRIKHKFFEPYVVDCMYDGWVVKEVAKNGIDYTPVSQKLAKHHISTILCQRMLTDREGEITPMDLFKLEDAIMKELTSMFDGTYQDKIDITPNQVRAEGEKIEEKTESTMQEEFDKQEVK